MASFLDHIGQRFYEGVIDNNKGIELFTILDAWAYLIEVAKEDSRVVACALSVEKTGDHYKISQLMINKRGEPQYSKGEFVLGHIWEAYDLDDDLLEIAKSGKLYKMSLERLRLKANSKAPENKRLEEDE